MKEHERVDIFSDKERGIAKVIKLAERSVYIAVSIVLLVIAVSFLCYTVYSAFIGFMHKKDILHTVITAIQDVLLVIIILEILWTVMSYIELNSIPLEPFLFVAIISSVRGLILKSTKSIEMVDQNIYKMVADVGIHVFEIFILIVALYILRKSRKFL